MSKSGPKKLKMESPEITLENVEKIAGLFPGVVTEIEDEDGILRKGIDFDLLKQELSGDYVEGREERYEFTWVGKKQSIVEANLPIQKTLRPCMEESKDWEKTENIYIEGDNLEALKLLQESYLNKVKMIYIDPPYNTGNDFIYNDSFVIDVNEYDDETGAVDELGNRLIKNNKDRGRYHSDWCSMLFSRLKLAYNLLIEEGVIFVSIDDNEAHNLRKIMDEIFGEENFKVDISWQKRYTRSNNTVDFTTVIEHIIVYEKSDRFIVNLLPRTDEADARYGNPDNDHRGPWISSSYVNPATKAKRPNLVYSIKNPVTNAIVNHPTHAWKYDKQTHELHITENRLYWGLKGDYEYPRLKSFLSEARGLTPINFWSQDYAGNTDIGTADLSELLGGKFFDNPKPVKLLKRIIEHSCDHNSLILDFFAGSSTTAQAVMNLNSEDGGSRKFIMIQLPEPCEESSEAFKAGFTNISEIGKERIRRAGEQIKAEIETENQQAKIDDGPKAIPDIGFRVFKIDDTNMKEVYYSAGEYSQETLEGLVDNVKEERTDLDLLYQVLIDWGLPLNLEHKMEKIDGFNIHIVDKNALIACFDANIPESVMRKIAEKKPLRAVFQDGSFKSSPGKLNIEGIFKTSAPETNLRVI